MVLFSQKVDSLPLLSYLGPHLQLGLLYLAFVFHLDRVWITEEEVCMLTRFVHEFQVLGLLNFEFVSKQLVLLG